MSQKKVLIISVTEQDKDPRVMRQINFLKDNFDIYCCGIGNKTFPQEKFFRINASGNSLPTKIKIGVMKLFKLYEQAEEFILKKKFIVEGKEKAPEFDVIIANDMDSVPIAFKIFKAKKIIADFHEYAPLEFEDRFYWKYIHTGHVTHQCRKYFPMLDEITTVCNGIAEEYDKNFSRLPMVITNAAGYYDLKPSPVKDKIRMIHHGAAISSRKLEIMIETARYLDERFSLDFMLVPNEPDYLEKLKEMSKDYKNVNFIKPVALNEIVKFCNPYDIGIVIVPPVNMNYKFGLGNKFFEFIQSRLALVTGPMIEMAYYINKYELGIATKSFVPEEIANEINSLTDEQIQSYKNNSDRFAKELSSETNKEILNGIVTNLLKN